MVNRALHPSEIETFYILPALRRELTKCMKKNGKTQKQVAKLLGVTEAAVSQYVSSKRASKVKFNEQLRKAIEACSLKITDNVSLMAEVQHLLKLTRDGRVACQVHMSLGISSDCNACFQNERNIS